MIKSLIGLKAKMKDYVWQMGFERAAGIVIRLKAVSTQD